MYLFYFVFCVIYIGYGLYNVRQIKAQREKEKASEKLEENENLIDGQKQDETKAGEFNCCCQSALIDVSENTARNLFILSALGWSIFGSCLDRKGCNPCIFFINFVPIVNMVTHYEIYKASIGKL